MVPRLHAVYRLFLGIICLLFPVASLRSTDAPVKPNAVADVASSWFVDPIDAGGPAGDDVGAHLSLARNPQNGFLAISYYDATHADLRLARQDGARGDSCGPGGRWSCETVDSTGDVGQFSSLAMDPVSGYPHIAYYDATARSLKYAAYACTPHVCSWSTITIDGGLAYTWTGQYPSLKIGSDGIPRIAYYRSGLLYGALKFATRVGTGGNCGPGASWQCDVIDGTGITGLYPSLDLTSATSPYDVPYIAYYDKTNGNLRWTWRLGNGSGDCGPNNDWRCMTIDAGDFGADVGRFPALRLIKGSSSEDQTGIAYYDADNDRIRYAYPENGGACGGGLWQCDTITSGTLTNGATPFALDLAGDAVYRPAIAYGCPACYGHSLNIARYVGASGNCGPMVQLFPSVWTHTWQCDVTLGDPQTVHDYSQAAGLDINGSGLMTLAFYDATSGDLMLAQQRTSVYLPLVIR